MRATAVSVLIRSDLFLVRQPVAPASVAKPSDVPVDFLLLVDVSGSMSGELAGVREHAKRLLRENTKAADTVTLVAFSGNDQCYDVFTAEPIASLPDVDRVNRLIDRWLTPVGMTNFVEPFERAAAKIASLGKNGRIVSALFQSDGCETCGNSMARVLGAVDTLVATGRLGSFCVVEYGPWADHRALDQIAKRAGGVLIHARDFRDFAPRLGDFLARRPLGVKLVSVPVGDAIEGFAFRIDDGAVATHEVTSGAVRVPEATSEVFYLSPVAVGKEHVLDLSGLGDEAARGRGDDLIAAVEPYLSAAYAAVGCFASVMNAEVVEALLGALGDVAFARRYGACFGIENTLAFVETAMRAATGTGRFVAGYQANCVPPDDATTVLDVIALLKDDPETRILTEHPRFEYKRIGRKQVSAATHLSAAEQGKLTALRDEMSQTNDVARVRAITAEIDALLAAKGVELRFEAAPAPDGYPIDNVVHAADRANLSIRVKRPGTVAIEAARVHTLALKDTPATTATAIRGLPEQVITHDYKTFTLLKDGRLNVATLPVTCSRGTLDTLLALGVVEGAPRMDEPVIVKLDGLPVINRRMRARVTPEALFGCRYRHLKAQAAGKVYGHYRKLYFGDAKRMRGVAGVFGDAAAPWLLSLGIADSGWSPKTVQAAPSGDVYRAKVVDIDIEGLSTLPAVDKVLERREKIATEKKAGKGKSAFTASMALLVPTIEAVEAEMVRRGLTVAKDKLVGKDASSFEAWLEQREREADRLAASLGFERSRLVYAISEGRAWPWKDPKQTEAQVTVDGEVVTGRIKLTEPEVAL